MSRIAALQWVLATNIASPCLKQCTQRVTLGIADRVTQSLTGADTIGGKRRHSSGDSGYTDDLEGAEISPNAP